MDNSDKNESHHTAKEHLDKAASHLLKEGTKKAKKLYHEGLNKTCEWEHSVEECAENLIGKIKNRPLTSVFIAAGIGYILAKLTK